jgi:hypothetical protein
VSEAAQGETPEGWTNHGEYVSAVARGLVQPGDPKPAEDAAATLKVKPAKADKAVKPDKPVKPTH